MQLNAIEGGMHTAVGEHVQLTKGEHGISGLPDFVSSVCSSPQLS